MASGNDMKAHNSTYEAFIAQPEVVGAGDRA